MTTPPPKKLLYVGHTNPWDRNSGSGSVLRICSLLNERGLLHGGIHPFDPESRHFLHGTGYNSTLNRIKRRFKEGYAREMAASEADGFLPEFLESMEPGSPVLYHFHVPTIEPRLDLRRYFFQDLTPSDALRYKAYGHQKVSQREIDQSIEHISKVTHSPQTAGIMTYSTYGADSIAREYNFPRDKIMPIGCGPIRSQGLPKDLSVERYQAGRILFVGRNWEKKGGPILLEAFKLLRDSADTAHAKLVILGPKNQPENTIGVPGIEFLGRVSDAEVADAFKSASLFCMVPDCETWGIVYVEAADAGLPIVGFSDWALPDIVKNNETGILISERSPAALAKGLGTLISDPEKLLMMGRAAHDRVESVLGWEHVINRITKMVWPALLGAASIPTLDD